MAEPFDGMNRGELLTPLLAQHLQKKFNVVAVSQCGRSSGPKYGQNLLDIATSMTSLSTPFVHSNAVSVLPSARSPCVPAVRYQCYRRVLSIGDGRGGDVLCVATSHLAESM